MTQPDNHENTHHLILVLDDQEMKILERLAKQMCTTPQEAAQQALSARLTRLTHQGPGMTLADLKRAVASSTLSEIVDADDTWDDAMVDETLVWERNQDGEHLLDCVHFLFPARRNLIYHQATFQQDPSEPHHWRAWFEAYHPDLGELGDLPENEYPHFTVREAADALAAAYRERYP